MYVEGSDEIFFNLYQSSSGFLSDHLLEKIIQEIKLSDKGILFMPKNLTTESIDCMKADFDKLISLGVNLKDKFIGVNLYNSDNYLTGPICEKLKQFEAYLSTQNANLVIVAEDLFNLDQIVITNMKLDDEVNYINSLRLEAENNRPLNDMEKFLMVYDFCTNFKYQENENHKEYSRNITSILNSTDIVCVGYAILMREMCARLGIECYNISSTVIDKELQVDIGGHQNNIVVLDNKMYYADACWDCYTPKSKGLKLYNHCLIPIEDKNNFAKVDVDYNEFSCPLGKKDYFLSQAKDFLKRLEDDTLESVNEIDGFLLNFNKLNKNNETPTFDMQWDITKMKYDEFRKLKLNFELNIVIRRLKQYEYGSSIDYETFEKALMNTYLAKGMNEKSAQSLLDRTMDINERRAKKKFNKKATNCFVVGKTKELEL